MTETVSSDTVQKVKETRKVGDTHIKKETMVNSHQVNSDDLMLAKANQVIWLFIHIIAVILTLRFLFLLLSANLTGFALGIYNLSNIFVAPFTGIFPAPAAGGSYFDTAALFGIAMWYLLGYIITYVLALFSKRAV